MNACLVGWITMTHNYDDKICHNYASQFLVSIYIYNACSHTYINMGTCVAVSCLTDLVVVQAGMWVESVFDRHVY